MTNSERKRAYGARLQRHAATVDRHAEEHRQRAAKYATSPAVDVSKLTVRGTPTRSSAHYAPARTLQRPVSQTWETATWETAQRTVAPKRKDTMGANPHWSAQESVKETPASYTARYKAAEWRNPDAVQNIADDSERNPAVTRGTWID